MECPGDASGSTFPHLLPAPNDISRRDDIQNKNIEETLRRRASGERRMRHKNEEGVLILKLERKGGRVDAELPGHDEEEEGCAARETGRDRRSQPRSWRNGAFSGMGAGGGRENLCNDNACGRTRG
ncbi:hypothetical protein NDU88_007312 [Pleurodeles waltl]|uniref:Uncharacterized protein n=1 Tax=Pleurodeles waltl TaxID=8319 RepID=A0AAV7NUL0_PLEWA|nr:hypothetical protein NDU88_007312 [Pleurodeles waltl]